MSKTRHDVKRSKLCQHFVMKSKTFHDVKICVMTSKRCHDFNTFGMMSKHIITSKSSVKNMLWWRKVRHCFNMFIMKRHDVKRFIMTSKVCHEVKSCHEVKICYDVKDIKNVSWRKEHTTTLKRSSWRAKVRHGVESMSYRQTFHDVKTFAMMSKGVAYVMTSKSWLHQEFVMMS